MTLRNTDTKRKPAERFSVLIIPRNRSKIRRLEFSGRAIHTGLGLLAGIAAIAVVTVALLVFYRHAYVSTENLRVESAEFVREKAALLSRLVELEDSIGRTERFAAKIESAVETKKDGVAGKGPVDEDDGMPSEQWITPSGSSVTSLGNNIWKSPFSKSLTAGLNLALDKLSSRADDAEEKVHSVFALQQDKQFFWASLPSLWPSRGWVTSEFGEHRGWRGKGRLHEGIDIAGPRGTPILAPGDGTVTFSGYYHGYGQMVTVDHGYGISTLYGHCSAMFVKEGQRIKRGMIIAQVGNTGSSTGPHLHYEVHVDGVPVNPMMYVMQ